MREPTREEMIAGIAKGFTEFLNQYRPSCDRLSQHGIQEAIENGTKEAMSKFLDKQKK